MSDLHARIHANCEASWRCDHCQEPVCPRCEPSPREFELCATCAWFEDDDPEEAA